ncbi:MAG TPA: DeoR/GlpR family DNA-binding transcription regulator [Ktedonobacteraceae bacterium]|jgi:DeoR family transcriptional regulator of aga operon|nr:DeoR/GlpR family DNA-binding transcription regulator [Ktedonobacteraceae bacterium]
MTETPRIDGEIPTAMRREQLLKLIKAKDFVKVSDLSARFGVSEVTIRGDLDALAGNGYIRRIRGGAMPSARTRTEQPFEEAISSHVAEKMLIGKTAANLVVSGETIILDVGTTTTAVAQELVKRIDLQDVVVFTNALNIALELERAIPRFTVVVIGGTLRPLQHSLVDPLGGLMLERINAHTIFLGCNGIHPTGGITNINLPEGDIKRRMLQSARRRIVVADSTKVGEVALAHLCDIEQIDLLITDNSANADTLSALRERDLEVTVAK